MQIGRHAGHGDVGRSVMTVTFGQVDAFFRFVHVFFREGGTVGVCVVSTAVLGEVVGAGESFVAQMADVGTLRSVRADVSVCRLARAFSRH